MNDFSFFNPTRIEFGRDKENKIGTYISEYQIKKVLIVYGSERIKRDGLYDRVTRSLNDAGIEHVSLGGVVSNPLLSKVREGIKLAKENQVQGILAVGGGSVLDSVKAIAAGAAYEGDVWDFFIFKSVATEALPLFSILTLAATGSEMNNGSVVMNDDTMEKYAFMSPKTFPTVSVINPELMNSVSKDYLAYSASDIIAHCLDLYFTAQSIPEFNLALIENIIQTVFRTTEILLENPNDTEARGEFAWASTMALNQSTFVGAAGNSYDTHMIEHALSALYNVPHGAGLSIVMPAWMRWHKETNPARYERFAKKLFDLDTADSGIDALEAWFKKIGTPVTLEEGEVPRDGIPALAENAFGLANMWGLGQKYSTKTIETILNMA